MESLIIKQIRLLEAATDAHARLPEPKVGQQLACGLTTETSPESLVEFGLMA